MISRRSLLTTGGLVAVGAAGIAGAATIGRLDDVAGAVGITPRPQPDQGDVARLESTAEDVSDLLAALQGISTSQPKLADQFAPLESICQQHLTAVSGVSEPSQRAAEPKELADLFTASATQRTTDATVSVAPEVAMLLASMAASHTQCARIVQGIA